MTEILSRTVIEVQLIFLQLNMFSRLAPIAQHQMPRVDLNPSAWLSRFEWFLAHSKNELMQWSGVRRLSVRLSVNFCANRFFSQANGRIATKLAHDGLRVSVHPGCARGQGQGQRSRDTRTFLDSWNELLRHWRSGCSLPPQCRVDITHCIVLEQPESMMPGLRVRHYPISHLPFLRRYLLAVCTSF